MFSEASVSHSVHGGGVPQGGLPTTGESASRGCLPPGGSASRGSTQPPRYRHLVAAAAAVGMHPTGMHSCYTAKIGR